MGVIVGCVVGGAALIGLVIFLVLKAKAKAAVSVASSQTPASLHPSVSENVSLSRPALDAGVMFAEPPLLLPSMPLIAKDPLPLIAKDRLPLIAKESRPPMF